MSSVEMKFFKVCSEFDIGDDDNPYVAYFKAKSIHSVFRHLEDYCCDQDLDYNEQLEEGMFHIEEISPDSLFINLETD